ncbi:MAG: winged helix-turn-helix transcriptional regulator [Nocardia sp.]|nr:winged helix-turn-helix transcriptional regulator [Nocardia sp.]
MEAFKDVDLAILGDPTRKVIFERLARKPASVGELAESLPITRQAVSQHLRVLKQGGLVVATPEGTKRIYRINPDGLAAIQAYFQHLWDDALTAFQKAADSAAADPEQENRP